MKRIWLSERIILYSIIFMFVGNGHSKDGSFLIFVENSSKPTENVEQLTGNDSYRAIVSFPDIAETDSFPCNFLNGTNLLHRTVIILDISSKISFSVSMNYLARFVLCITSRLLLTSAEWIPLLIAIFKSLSSSEIQQIQRSTALKQYLALNSKIFLTSAETQKDGVFWELYRVKEKMRLSQCIGDLRGILPLDAIAERRSNFHLENMTVSAKPSKKPGRSDIYYISNTVTHLSVLYFDLMKLMNFSENFIAGDSPTVSENGTLMGLTLDQLNSGLADITLTKMSLTPPRAQFVDFLIPTHRSGVYVFFKQPTPNSIHDLVTAPFHTKLWITTLITWAVIVVAIKVNIVLAYLSEQKDTNFAKDAFMWSVSTASQKAWHTDPVSISLRVTVLAGIFTSMVVYVAYSAFFVSALAVGGIPIRSFSDLYKDQNLFTFTVYEGSLPFRGLLRDIIEENGLDQSEEMVSIEMEVRHLFTRVSDTSGGGTAVSSKKALLSYADIFYTVALLQNFSAAFICNHISYFVMDVRFLSKSSMMVKKGSEFKETLNFMLIHLRAVGLIYRHNRMHDEDFILKCVAPESNVNSFSAPATLSDVFTIFIILLCGISICLAIFFIEAFLSHWFILIGCRKETKPIDTSFLK